MTEPPTNTALWDTLEQWSPRLFLLGSVFILIFALHNGIVYLTDATFQDWMYPSVLLGRLAVLLGIAGLSVQLVSHTPQVGKLGRVVVVVAVGFTIGLLVLGPLEMAGIFSTPFIGVVGLGTVILSVLTYALFGVAILRTGAYSTLIGGLLLAATVVLLALFVGLMTFPARLAGAVGEGALFALFVSIGYSLRAEFEATDRAAPAPDTPVR